jgi:hypothetical protein
MRFDPSPWLPLSFASLVLASLGAGGLVACGDGSTGGGAGGGESASSSTSTAATTGSGQTMTLSCDQLPAVLAVCDDKPTNQECTGYYQLAPQQCLGNATLGAACPDGAVGICAYNSGILVWVYYDAMAGESGCHLGGGTWCPL